MMLRYKLINCKIIVGRPRRLKVDVYSERYTSHAKHGPWAYNYLTMNSFSNDNIYAHTLIRLTFLILKLCSMFALTFLHYLAGKLAITDSVLLKTQHQTDKTLSFI
jgi:hypothetical protein